MEGLGIGLARLTCMSLDRPTIREWPSEDCLASAS